ncbi:MAG: hypothetical protein H6601_12490 [Flavobacteriales bacterium]|nr:hypothetical protein [Flavobacteriales bacterium]
MKTLWVALYISLILILAQSCVVAPPSPMVSFGGSRPVGKYVPELTAASGAGLSLSDKPRGSEMAWYSRFRFGITDKMDIGAEAMGFRFQNNLNLSGKISARYSFKPWLRADIGAGMGDNAYGRSVNGDVGITFGTAKDRVWNPYGTLRYGFAYGLKGTGLKPALEGVELGRLLNSHTFMLNVGAEAKLIPYIYFLAELGFGQVFPVGQRNAAIIYLSGGFSFRLPRKKD